MKVLIGTTNPSKVKRFNSLLKDLDLELITLKDLNIHDEPTESGKTPEENAIIKAKFYSKYADLVICNDSGLYFEELDLLDERQPGLNVRTPMHKPRLDDEEMIKYYSALVKTLGGRVTAYYLDGIAVYNNGKISSFMDQKSARGCGSFYMISEVSPKRNVGWPLDSISVYLETNQYFVDQQDSKKELFANEYEKKIIAFLKEALLTR